MAASFLWPAEDGWPYPDPVDEPSDPAADVDEDALALHTLPRHALDALSPLERRVLEGRFGLDGCAECTMRQLHEELGVSRAELRDAMGSGLAKLRSALAT